MNNNKRTKGKKKNKHFGQCWGSCFVWIRDFLLLGSCNTMWFPFISFREPQPYFTFVGSALQGAPKYGPKFGILTFYGHVES